MTFPMLALDDGEKIFLLGEELFEEELPEERGEMTKFDFNSSVENLLPILRPLTAHNFPPYSLPNVPVERDQDAIHLHRNSLAAGMMDI